MAWVYFPLVVVGNGCDHGNACELSIKQPITGPIGSLVSEA